MGLNQIHVVEWKETKEWAIDDDPFLSLMVLMCFSCCKFMVLKKWVVLHLCVLIHDDSQNNLLFLMFFGSDEIRLETLVVVSQP
jgi:hypothetical protein